jgi:protein-S-isoprenylcysteine O-methyltransferase Ste14
MEAANEGWLRPPLVFLIAILAGAALEWLWPLRILPAGLSAIVGATLLAAGAGVFFWSVRTLHRAHTPVPGNKPTTAIVRTGPYRFSRNPIYVAFCLLQLGTAALLNSLWVVVTLGAAVALIAWLVIPREERYLEARFGAEYLEYMAAVRRWL